ncbi:hypothetical protein SLEP1_g56480 [Rubroshorea leprosula]|uniref:Uncharacterized protein n=1 Tax=Rubroshorea leprosula TaxID=152421 RepID=A0AAV5MIF4_9ROSI|nr:hypothetical protein SLEP1_g56480 [Rubroshorea leprosula]
MMPICPVLLVFSACEARMGVAVISGAKARDWGEARCAGRQGRGVLMMARACRGIIAGSGAQQGKQSAGDLVQSAGAGAEQSWCRKQGRVQQSADDLGAEQGAGAQVQGLGVGAGRARV